VGRARTSVVGHQDLADDAGAAGGSYPLVIVACAACARHGRGRLDTRGARFPPAAAVRRRVSEQLGEATGRGGAPSAVEGAPEAVPRPGQCSGTRRRRTAQAASTTVPARHRRLGRADQGGQARYGVLRAEGRPVGMGMTSRIESQPDSLSSSAADEARQPLPSALCSRVPVAQGEGQKGLTMSEIGPRRRDGTRRPLLPGGCHACGTHFAFNEATRSMYACMASSLLFPACHGIHPRAKRQRMLVSASGA
jgi:hypothetical protein